VEVNQVLGVQSRFVQLNVAHHDSIRHMQASDAYTVTDKQLMRGFDYRTECEMGIALLIMRPFESHRAFHQALGRVGRYGQPCKRFLLEGLTPVPEAARLALIGHINNLERQQSQAKKTKK
jgi:hypothetical protein